jgi:hypothetical protein
MAHLLKHKQELSKKKKNLFLPLQSQDKSTKSHTQAKKNISKTNQKT